MKEGLKRENGIRWNERENCKVKRDEESDNFEQKNVGGGLRETNWNKREFDLQNKEGWWFIEGGDKGVCVNT